MLIITSLTCAALVVIAAFFKAFENNDTTAVFLHKYLCFGFDLALFFSILAKSFVFFQNDVMPIFRKTFFRLLEKKMFTT